MSKHHQKLDRRRWEAVRRRVLDAARWRCAMCRRYANECDHVRPLKLGGGAIHTTKRTYKRCVAGVTRLRLGVRIAGPGRRLNWSGTNMCRR